MILLLDHLDSFTFNLYQYIEELGFRCRVERANRMTLSGVRRLSPRAIVLSPGPGHPREASLAIEILRELSPRVPTLGVCLGHQAIGLAFGARIGKVARPLHGKVSLIRHEGVGVFRGLPQGLPATRYHSLCVEGDSLPACLAPTAWAERVVMGLRHREHPIEGVQFHPESVRTPSGKRMLSNFLKEKR